MYSNRASHNCSRRSQANIGKGQHMMHVNSMSMHHADY